MKTPDSTIFYVVHHTLGPRHFLVIFKHYEEGFQRCNYRLRSIHFLFQSQSFFFYLWFSMLFFSPKIFLQACTTILLHSPPLLTCVLRIPLGIAFPSSHWAECPPNRTCWLFSSFLEKAHLLQVFSHHFFVCEWFTHWSLTPSSPTFLPVFWWWYPLITLSTEKNKY